MKRFRISIAVLLACLLTAACGSPEKLKEAGDSSEEKGTERESQVNTDEMYTRKTKITDVITDEVFGDYGRLIFPVESAYYSGDTLGN